MLEHGGRLRSAALEFNIPLDDWIDLSTGISPISYPVGPIPTEVWHRLPESEDSLVTAAATYYETSNIIATAGSQAAIQALPRLRKAGQVAALETSYNEHAHAWVGAGHELRKITDAQLENACASADVVVLCNPNNPTGLTFQRQRLKDCLRLLVAHGGWLVIDEAFMDVTPDCSLIGEAGQPGLIVLRSLGKFFGLAGARVGFVAAWPELLVRLNRLLGPWTLSGPARFAAMQALSDRAFQDKARVELLAAASAMRVVLTRNGLTPTGSTAFFHWVCTENAVELNKLLMTMGICTRLFTSPLSIRFGLSSEWQHLDRLDRALAHACSDHVQLGKR